MTTIVLLATAWGSKHGGINVVNMELTRALAQVLGTAGRVVCVVPYADDDDIKDAERSGAALVSLGLDPTKLPDHFDPGWIGTVEKRLKAACVGTADWCIGHDAITGAAANAMRQEKYAEASAVISHMSYADYQGVKHEGHATPEGKIEEQKRVLREADRVIAVGPLLRKRANTIVGRQVPALIPGLPDIEARPFLEHFEAVSFGRFERANDRIKQIRLAAEGFAEACRRARDLGGPSSLLDNPHLKLIGIAGDDKEIGALRRATQKRARQIVTLRPIPYQEDRQKLYAEISTSSVALMLSWHEGFGLTGWEAIAAEVPLVVTEQSGLHQLLREEALDGFVYSVHVEGDYGDSENLNFTKEDRKRVADLIWKVAQEPERARKAAKILKEKLLAQGCTWPNAAYSVLEALGTPRPAGPSPGSGGAHDPQDISGQVTSVGPSLAAYLARVREKAGQVTLAGDREPRLLQDVFVELEVTRGGMVESRKRGGEKSQERSDEQTQEEQNQALKQETRRRKKERWAQVVETIPIEDLLDFAHRTLIVGAAGTGKSTLLRWLACAAAKRLESDAMARIPVWLSGLPPHKDMERDLAGTLAKEALANVDLSEGPSEAAQAIAEAIALGRALVLIDGIDESGVNEQDHAEEWLAKLEGRVVLASRPLLGGAPLRDIKTVTLHGIPGIAAEQLLRGYFAGEDWVGGLLEALRSLPDGQTWLETPALLGLAATLYRADKSLPRATIELYRRAVSHLLSLDRIAPKYRGDELRSHLQAFARNRLLPAEGAPRVIFDLNDVSYRLQEAYSQTGLIEGSARFRFSHLTLGEYLAAEAEIDLGRERAKLLATQGRALEGSSLEVVPMAHALRGTTALQDALAEARERDLSDHRLLRLLLRALGYGGKGVEEFCSTHASEVIRLVAERLDAPSGRFGGDEVALMDAAERAFLVMRGLVDKAYVERVFGRLLRLPGDVGTEAHVATWVLGVREPERRESDWWPTVERQARALVRAGIDVDGVLRLTQGADRQNQWRAACDLSRDPELWPRLRHLLYHDQDMGRRHMSMCLANDGVAAADWCERLGDEDSYTRHWCAAELGAALSQRTIFLPRLRDMLVRDPNAGVRACLIDILANDTPSRGAIRGVLSSVASTSFLRNGDVVLLQGAAIRALATDPESGPVIREYIGLPKQWWFRGDGVAETLQRLVSFSHWRQLLVERLGAPDIGPQEIAALANDAAAEESIRRLLDSDDARVVRAAVEALGARVDRSRLLQLLDHRDERLRCAAIAALGGEPSALPELRRFLVGSPAERIAAAKALSHDADALGAIRDNVLYHPRTEVTKVAVEVLSSYPSYFAALRDYFEEKRTSPDQEWVREEILKVLARVPEYRGLVEASLDDPHGSVRAVAVCVLAAEPAMAERLRQRFYADDAAVYEAFCDAMPHLPFVKEHLLWCLNADLGALRFSCFRYLVEHAAERQKLKGMLASKSTREEWRTTMLEPFMGAPDSVDLVRACAGDDEPRDLRREALRLLRHDRVLRQDLREKARDYEWIKSVAPPDLVPFFRDYVPMMLSDDPEVHPILMPYLDAPDDNVVAFVVRMLRDYLPARPKLVELLDHRSVAVRAAAMYALGTAEPVRDRLVAALAPNPPFVRSSDVDVVVQINHSHGLDLLRQTAADVLKDVPELRGEFRALLDNKAKGVREAAIHSVSADRSSEALRLLRERLAVEEEADLRSQIISALQGDPGSVEPLRVRLQHDYKRAVRKEAAVALGLGDLSPAHALREQPSVARVLRLLAGVAAPELNSLHDFLRAPRSLDLDAEPELGEDILGWLCGRLGWAYEIGHEGDGQVLGEVERPLVHLSAPGGLVLIRVAMDTFSVPRERFLRPNHNLMEVWDVARRLVASDPPTIVLACADVAFAHLQPPRLEPGEVRFGPTLFGFRVNRCLPNAS